MTMATLIKKQKAVLNESLYQNWYYQKFPHAQDIEHTPIAHRTKLISLEQFPPVCLLHIEGNISYFLADYIAQLIKDNDIAPGCCLFLPSLESLTRLLKVEEIDIKRAFTLLKMKGHHYQFSGYYGNIALWTNAHPIDEENN